MALMHIKPGCYIDGGADCKELFLMSGREHGEDDDTPMLVTARNKQHAIDVFREALRDLEGLAEDATIYVCSTEHVGQRA